MEDNETPRREDGKPRRPRRVISKDHPQESAYQYHQSVDGESQSANYHANSDNNNNDHGDNRRSDNDNGDRGGYRRNDNGGDRGGYRRSDNGDRGGYRRSDNGDGDRGGYRRSDNGDGDRGGYRRSDNDGDRGGYRRSDNGDGDRGGYRRNDNGDGDRGGYRRNDGGDNRGGYRRNDNGGYHSSADDNREGYRSRANGNAEGREGQGRQDGYNRGGGKRYSQGNRGDRRPMPHKPRKVVVIPETARPNPANDGLTRLNKYLGNAGVCSRREADKLIAAGAVKVNGEVVTTMGYMVKPEDVITYGGETLQREKKRYLLLNKPKGYITTTDDPEGRHTVMELVRDAYKERIYPVGRLDRNTTGLLLFTNDGDLSRKLMHPSTGIYKIYHVELDKPLSGDDMQQMREGMELEDGPIKVDDIQYVGDGADKRIIGVAIHSGRNRIVRRIFESLGYEVSKLDRVVFAGLTKKDLPRGRHRDLTEKEVSFLKMI